MTSAAPQPTQQSTDLSMTASMTTSDFTSHLKNELNSLEDQGLYKHERVITSSQSAEIDVTQHPHVLNLCANNYLGLADDERLVTAAHEALDTHGYGMASVRFICGTTDLHKELEHRLAAFLGMEDGILFPSSFSANVGLFECMLTAEDAIISDELNHASIIDGVRLCKAKRYRYKNNDMSELEEKLKQADQDGARFKLIVTDGVFSMEGIIANLPAICDLKDKYGAILVVDDCHATGFMGTQGRGTHEHFDVMDRVDIMSTTLGKGMGGAIGGFVAANKTITEWLRNRARPYLFSNSIPPSTVKPVLTVLDIIEKSTDLRDKVMENAQYFRQKMEAAGLTLIPGEHPIVPVLIGDAKLAQTFADRLMDEGVYVIGFSYPVVPNGRALIRTQMSAAHTFEELDRAVSAFAKVGAELGLIS